MAFQKKLISETIMLAASLMFPFAKINPGKSPILVISGEDDAVFTVEEGNITAEKYGAKKHYYQGAGS